MITLFFPLFANDHEQIKRIPDSSDELKALHGGLYGACTVITDFATKNDLTDIQEAAASFNEIGHYFGAILRFYTALDMFSKNNNVKTPEIICKFCPEKSLPCDQLMVKVQAKAMDKSIGANDSVANKVRKKMLLIYDDITLLLYKGPFNDVEKCMVKIAQEGNIPCEGCHKVKWQALDGSKSKV